MCVVVSRHQEGDFHIPVPGFLPQLQYQTSPVPIIPVTDDQFLHHQEMLEPQARIGKQIFYTYNNELQILIFLTIIIILSIGYTHLVDPGVETKV